MLTPDHLFSKNQPAFHKGYAAGLLVVWALMNGYLVKTYGIVSTVGEPPKYVFEAETLIHTGHLTSASYWLYFTQIALLAGAIKLKLSFAFVLFIQLICHGLAAICFYQTLLHLFRQEKVAFIGTMMLLLNYPYQQFNVYLQTESLFYSFTLILTYLVLTLEKPEGKKIFFTLLGLGIICITRPTGLLFIPPVFLYFFFVFLKRLSPLKKLGILACIAAAFFFLLNKAVASGGELDFMLPFREENIICEVPGISGFQPIQTAGNGNSIYGLLYYITHNFFQFTRLAGLKTMAFFGLYRNYYSTGHNIYLIIFFYSLHLLALAAIPWWLKYHLNKFVYLLSAILLVWMTVMLSCDDWHNRFYLSISPFIIILSIRSISSLLNLNADESKG
jgi:Dolichyl-phosphate-mannose-protein mannosyltransferase